ncbi:MAG: FAD-dependent thymidylate synthase [Candidatus Yanofskybacteria bacterium]|nr:FAD-dependent thymidylate synthase [Candidatus Yanofskybacteria bacterium]
MAEVIALAGWPPEVLAYAYAMYSRSALSIRESMLKITNEKASGFLDTFYFKYNHRSIADNAHVPLAIENASEIVAFELEDEQLWDGQERSTRYQNFNKPNAYFIPETVRNTPHEREYCVIADFLLGKYGDYSSLCFEYLAKKYSKPPEMKGDDYERTLKARAFDVARYWLFNGILTSVGQITSARTLEDQICRLMAAEYLETVYVANQMKEACLAKPFCPEGKNEPPVAPTLVKHVSPNGYAVRIRELMKRVMSVYLSNFMYPGAYNNYTRHVRLTRPFRSIQHEIVAGLVYEATNLTMRDIQSFLNKMEIGNVNWIIGQVLDLREKHDALPRAFAAGYGIQFDICMDIGGRRDLHRHRNCIQIHQKFTVDRGFDVPELVREMGKGDDFSDNMKHVALRVSQLKHAIGNNANYLIPFAFRAGTLYKMDYRQVEYMTVLRSTPQGHFSYREVAVAMDRQLRELVPGLEKHSRVTPFENEDIFKR